MQAAVCLGLAWRTAILTFISGSKMSWVSSMSVDEKEKELMAEEKRVASSWWEGSWLKVEMRNFHKEDHILDQVGSHHQHGSVSRGSGLPLRSHNTFYDKMSFLEAWLWDHLVSSEGDLTRQTSPELPTNGPLLWDGLINRCEDFIYLIKLFYRLCGGAEWQLLQTIYFVPSIWSWAYKLWQLRKCA